MALVKTLLVFTLVALISSISIRTFVFAAPEALPANIGQAIFPKTPAGRQLSELIHVVNSNQLERIQQFIASHYAGSLQSKHSAQDGALFWKLNHKYTQNLLLRRIEVSQENEVTVLLQASLTEQFFRIHLVVDANNPHLINGINIIPVALPDGFVRSKRTTQAEIARALDSYMLKLEKADVFSGTVLLAKDDKVIFQKAYGLADRNHAQPNRLDTSFNLASMSKMFTAIAVAQLVEAGKLSFSDLVGKHLPDYPNKAVTEKVTINHLLTHTSGLGNTFTSRPKGPLSFEPGTKFEYSTDGYLVLGLIIEKLSGMRYADYVREHIFKPAGMKDSGTLESKSDPPNRAIGYTNYDFSKWPVVRIDLETRRPTQFMGGDKGTAGGGSSSTVEDLLRFSLALQKHKLLNAEYTSILLTPKVQTTFGSNIKYAYGSFEESVNGVRIVSHGGDAPGVSIAFDVYPDLGYTAIILSNYDQSIASAVATKVRLMVSGSLKSSPSRR